MLIEVQRSIKSDLLSIIPIRTINVLMRSVILAVLLFIVGCSGRSTEVSVPKELPSSSDVTIDATEQELYETSKRLYEKGLYTIALGTLSSLVNNYPAGSYVEFAKVKLADSYYQTRDYINAVPVAEGFVRSHPVSSSAPFMAYLAARCSQLLYNGQGRDVAPLIRARENYEVLVKDYSDSYYFEKAQAEIINIDKEVAGYYKYIIDYYKLKGNSAAVNIREKEYTEYLNSHNTKIAKVASKVSKGVSIGQAKPLKVAKSIDKSQEKSNRKTYSPESIFVRSVNCRELPKKTVFINFVNITALELKKKLDSSKKNSAKKMFQVALDFDNNFTQNEEFECFGDSELSVKTGGKISYKTSLDFDVFVLDNPVRIALIEKTDR